MRPRDEILARYDREMRRDPVPGPGHRVERVGPVVRVVGSANYVLYSDLTEGNARAVVAEQAEHFRRARAEVEWKVFGHDRPASLSAALAAEGFVAGEAETLVVRDLHEGVPRAGSAAGVEVRPVTDAAGFRDVARVSESAFGRAGREFATRLAARAADPNQEFFVAYADGVPAATGRVELPPGRSFAGLYGGGTAPEFRHRGIYRELVAARAALAESRGYRYLTVDARETSRPILERLGFAPLTTTRPWVLPAPREGEPSASSPG